MSFSTSWHFGQWSMLAFCPRLLSLQIFSWEAKGTRFPGADFRSRINPFTTLERVILTNVPQRSVASLASWLNDAPCTQLPLTLLSITLRAGGSRRESIFSLLDALARAPNLQALHFDGLLYGKPDLISHIAHRCPRLEILYLIYWGQKRKESPRLPIPWPLPSYEYVPAFAHFSKLKHFGWNFRFHDMVYTPQHLPKVEDDTYNEKEFIRSDEDWLGPDKCFAKYMAVTVPTLETIAPRNMAFYDIRWIQRGQDGSVDIKADEEIPRYMKELIRYLIPDISWRGDRDRGWQFSPAELKSRGR